MSITVVSSSKVYANIEDLPENKGIENGDRFIVQTDSGTVLFDYENLVIDIEHTTFGSAITDLQEFQSVAAQFISTITDEFTTAQSDISVLRTDVDTIQAQIDGIKLILKLIMGYKNGDSEDAIELEKSNLAADGQAFMIDTYDEIRDTDIDFSLTYNNLKNIAGATSDNSSTIAELQSLVKAQNDTIADFETTIQSLPYYKVGDIKWTFSGNTPTGFLKLNGQSVSKTTYADLYSHLKSVFDWEDDDSTTFKLPNMNGAYPRVANTDKTDGAYTTYGFLKAPTGERMNPHVPNITGQIGWVDTKDSGNSDTRTQSGSLFWSDRTLCGDQQRDWQYFKAKINIDASKCSTVYNDDVKEVRTLTMVMYAYIKY